MGDIYKFEPWMKSIDVTLVGIESADKSIRHKCLWPYPAIKATVPNSTKGMLKRIAVIDAAIMKCMKL